MRRVLLAVLLCAPTLACWAQGYDPKVAYVVASGSAGKLILANEDGTKAVPVYTGGQKKALSKPDFAPGGGRIAFSESGTLKILSYTASAGGIAVNGIATVNDSTGAGSPDFSPDGSKLIYVGNLNATPQVREVATSGGPPRVLIGATSGVTEVAWLGSGSRFVYRRQYPSDLRVEVRLVELDAQGDVMSDSLLLTTDGPEGFRDFSYIDAARTSDAIIMTVQYTSGSRIAKYTLGPGTPSFTDYFPGWRARLSDDDAEIVFPDLSGQYVYSFQIASGTTTRLTKRGSYGQVDARP